MAAESLQVSGMSWRSGRKGEMMAAFSEEVRGDETQRINQRRSIDKGVGVDKYEW